MFKLFMAVHMKTKEEILSMLDQSLPSAVPKLPNKGTPNLIYVQITTESEAFWYKKNEVYRVFNKLFWGFYRGGPHFSAFLNSKKYPEYGIGLDHCMVLDPGTILEPKIPEYTLEELVEKLGHSFKLKLDAHGTTKK